MDEDIAPRLHETALDLLGDPGVRIEHDDIRALLLANGARPGAGPEDVRLPAELVRECLTRCPREFPLADRRGGGRVLTADGETTFWSCPGMYLHRRGEHRPFTADDMARAARLLEHLDNVDVVFGMALEDVPPPARDVVGLSIMAKNCSKHIRVLCFTPEGAEVLCRMKAVVGEEPWFSIGFTAHGPLRWTHLALEIFRRTAGHGIPVTVNGEPMAGVSGPVTLAGSAAVGNAEILAGIVINQLLEPGRPCLYNLGLAHVFDMKTAVAVTGAPENALFARLSATLGRFYGLPSGSWVSTEALCGDAQAGLEKMFGFHTHIESGVSAVWGVGQLESELTFSPAQAVMDDEMIAYARRFHRGVEVTPEALAEEVTREVGIAGSFLEHLHTARHFRRALFEPRLLWRRRRADWEREGRPRLEARAEERAEELMAREPAGGLTEAQRRALDEITSDFLARCRGEGS